MSDTPLTDREEWNCDTNYTNPDKRFNVVSSVLSRKFERRITELEHEKAELQYALNLAIAGKPVRNADELLYKHTPNSQEEV